MRKYINSRMYKAAKSFEHIDLNRSVYLNCLLQMAGQDGLIPLKTDTTFKPYYWTDDAISTFNWLLDCLLDDTFRPVVNRSHGLSMITINRK